MNTKQDHIAVCKHGHHNWKVTGKKRICEDCDLKQERIHPFAHTVRWITVK